MKLVLGLHECLKSIQIKKCHFKHYWFRIVSDVSWRHSRSLHHTPRHSRGLMFHRIRNCNL